MRIKNVSILSLMEKKGHQKISQIPQKSATSPFFKYFFFILKFVSQLVKIQLIFAIKKKKRQNKMNAPSFEIKM